MPSKELQQIFRETIHAHSEWLIISANRVVESVEKLHDKYNFETKADDAMKRAEDSLYEALRKVMKARDIYKNLPVEKPTKVEYFDEPFK